MHYCTLLIVQLLALQGADASVLVGRTYPLSSDSLYRSGPELGVYVDYPFTQDLAGRLHYSHTWVRSKTVWGWESRHSDEISGTLRLIRRPLGLADCYLFGGGGLRVNPDDRAKLSMCYGIGVKKTVSRWISVDLGLRLGHVPDEAPALRNWLSLYASLAIPFAPRATEHLFTKEDELEIITRYLAPGVVNFPQTRTGSETEALVEEFWAANDPIPHTPENELREEILSRVEYANAFFRDTREGWKTDRGRIWIIWGEPDELIREELRLHPVECWVYFVVYKGIMPVVFVFEQRELYRQVFSNIPGEFGHNAPLEAINPAIDQYTQRRWSTPDEP